VRSRIIEQPRFVCRESYLIAAGRRYNAEPIVSCRDRFEDNA